MGEPDLCRSADHTLRCHQYSSSSIFEDDERGIGFDRYPLPLPFFEPGRPIEGEALVKTGLFKGYNRRLC